MKSKRTIALLALLVVVLGVGAYTVSQSDSLQGTFPGLSSTGTLSLSASSPLSGARTVSASDELFAFDWSAPSTKDVTINDWTRLDFMFQSDDDLNPDADGDMVELYSADMAEPIGHGFITMDTYTPEEDYAYASVYFTWATGVDAGSTQTYFLKVNSANLLNEDTGEDDPLMVTMVKSSILGKSTTITGNTMNY
ncbi:MAG: hypothetical protein WC897_03995 [Candidatus Gracilibacteria bacterium]